MTNSITLRPCENIFLLFLPFDIRATPSATPFRIEIHDIAKVFRFNSGARSF